MGRTFVAIGCVVLVGMAASVSLGEEVETPDTEAVVEHSGTSEGLTTESSVDATARSFDALDQFQLFPGEQISVGVGSSLSFDRDEASGTVVVYVDMERTLYIEGTAFWVENSCGEWEAWGDVQS